MKIWVDHFQRLPESRLGDTAKGLEQQEKIKVFESQLHENEEFLLDVPFTAEVFQAVAKLKKRKAPGPDGLMAEHLRAGGDAVVI